MKSLKTKLLVVIVGIILISNCIVAFVAYNISEKELTNAVHAEMDASAKNVSSDIVSINNAQYKMLSTLAVLPVMRDPSVSLEVKYNTAHSVAIADKSYVNVAYYSEKGMSYTADGRLVDLSDRDYFKQAMQGKKYVSDPYVSSVDNNLTMVYSVPVIGDDGKPCGAVAAIVSGEMLSDVVSKIVIGKSSNPSVINMNSGMTVGSVDRDSVRNGQNINDAPTAEMKALFDNLRTGVQSGGGFYDPAKKIQMTCAYMPVQDDSGWAVFCAAPYDDFFGGLKKMVLYIVISVAAVVVFAVLFCVFMIASSLKPLLIVKKTINGIASGDADLTQRIDVKSKDEIGDVCIGFNAFTGKLHTIITDVKHSKDVLIGAGEDLEQSTEDTASSITQILANIESVHNQITNQAASVEETAGAVNEIASNIGSLERMIENQSSGVTQASAAVEEMIGNIGSVNSSVEKMANSFEDLQANAQAGSAKQEDVNTRIDQIKNQSQMLQDANQAIAAIASQTNLLAMNAAIEAAHAGDAGKGFSVVADEIRKLSETSSVQSKTIGEQLQKIQESIDTVVTASSESNIAFMTVSSKIKETDELVRQIKSAMMEQTEGSKQIGDALHSMNDSTSEVRTASAEMSAGNKAILEEVKHLQDATMVMKDSMNEMAVGAKKINETGEALHEISTKMKDSINEIGSQIDQFKV